MSYLKHYFCVMTLLTTLLMIQQDAFAQATSSPKTADNGVLFITGMLQDMVEKVSISGKEFDLNADGNAVLQVSLHESGRYAIALIKEYLPNTSDLVIKVDGYKDYIVQNLDDLSDYVNLDISLEPIHDKKLSAAAKKQKAEDNRLHESPSNPFILKF